MDIRKRLLTQSSLDALVRQLHCAGREIFAPVARDGRGEFGRISALDQMATDCQVTAQSAKFAVFPRVETLFDIEMSRDRVSLQEKDLTALPEVVLLGARPCDAAGFVSLWGIFGDDPMDPIVLARLDKLTIIGISCITSDARCFCTSMKLDPGGTRGSDILLTHIGNDAYLAEIITEKGGEIADEFSDLFAAPPDVEKDRYLAQVPVAFDLDELTGGICTLFDSDLWLEQSLRCIGCGTCAYVCPTCACFDIQDVSDGETGQRSRVWDSCGFSLFTLHASGHNPRETQAQRWRQRVLHKFAYMPKDRNLPGCVGCGRCSRLCPVDMNLREHLIAASSEISND